MPPAKDTSLAFISCLSPNVLYHDPKTSISPNHPSLILLLAWMGARDVHIAKYTAQCQRLFPSSPILLITFSWLNALHYSHDNLRPAADIIRAEAAAAKREGKADEVRLLIHLFSNGGAGSMRHLLDTIREVNSPDGKATGELAIPRHVFVCDSAPGYFHWMNAYTAMASNFPQWIRPLVHVWIAIGWILYVLPGRPTWFERNVSGCRDILFLANQTRRMYLYGDNDVMVDPLDIEDDAATVKKMVKEGLLGKTTPIVTLVKFEGSSHVAHARMDFDRYWASVSKVWDLRGAAS